ncbi:MAG: DUF1289 domain-containing protein [Bosea sp. (in: a-proteobacteria)]
MNDMTYRRPPSPCVKICVIDPASGFCEGCGRTMPEIAGWLRLSEPARQGVMRKLPERMKALKR